MIVSKRTGKDIFCKTCGKKFYVPKYRANTAQYCDRKCQGKGSAVLFQRPCVICGKIFDYKALREGRAKYCSRSCYYKAMKTKGSIEKECKHCESLFRTSPSKKQIFCSPACHAGYQLSKPITSFKNFSTVRQHFVTRGWIKECADCGIKETEILGIHHIDCNRENNTMENLVVLCANCHSRRHNKHIVHSGNPVG